VTPKIKFKNFSFFFLFRNDNHHFSLNIGIQEEHCQWQKSKGKSPVIVTSCSDRTLAMSTDRNIAANPNAAKQVKQLANSDGCRNPRTKTTSADRKTSSGFISGERSIRDTGVGSAKSSIEKLGSDQGRTPSVMA